MILIADSGSTKTDWRLIDPGVRTTPSVIRTKGMNPYLQTEEEIGQTLTDELLPAVVDVQAIEAVYFYGAGCTFDKTAVMRSVISRYIPAPVVEVDTDLLAAAHATCSRGAGIACILGTGSNSCFYDGTKIVHNVPPLGYILGDEGGGVNLGKQLVSDVLKGVIRPELASAFLEQYGLTPAQIIDRVYRQPFANRFLASFAPFLSAHIEEPEIHAIVLNGFKAFLTRNVMKYDYRHYAAHFTGSIACHFQPVLSEAAEATGVLMGTVCQSPLDGLTAYHTKNKSINE